MDLAMVWRNGFGYLQLQGADLAVEDGLRTAVLVSLFTDRQARVDDPIPDGTDDRRGHWADSFLPGDEQEGSRLWLLDREKVVPEVLRRSEDYSREALAWMIKAGAAKEVTATAWTTGRQDHNLRITITRPSGEIEHFEFLDMWNKEAQHGLYPVHRQLNILGDLLDTLIADLQPTGPAVEAFQGMRTYIAECQERNARYKSAYAASPDFVFLDKAVLEQRVLDELEGGLHEVIGGPLGTAVTPFS